MEVTTFFWSNEINERDNHSPTCEPGARIQLDSVQGLYNAQPTGTLEWPKHNGLGDFNTTSDVIEKIGGRAPKIQNFRVIECSDQLLRN